MREPGEYTLGDSLAHVDDGIVFQVVGHELKVGDTVLLAIGDAVSPSRRELFEALSIPLPDDIAETFTRNPPQRLDFANWGLQVWVDDQVDDRVTLLALVNHRFRWFLEQWSLEQTVNHICIDAHKRGPSTARIVKFIPTDDPLRDDRPILDASQAASSPE